MFKQFFLKILLLSLIAFDCRAMSASSLFSLTHYVSWPSSALAGDTFYVCVFGDNPFGNSLEELVKDKKVKGKAVGVKYYKGTAGLTSCHLLYINPAEKGRLSAVLGALGSSPVLTVSEYKGFAEAGGMINFMRQGNKRFVINQKAYKRAKLTISSKILRQAEII